jgi:hypothetical protein
MYDVLDWFGSSRVVIVLRSVFMYYAIKIGSSLFLSGCLEGFSGCLSDVLDVDLSSLFIVKKLSHRV